MSTDVLSSITTEAKAQFNRARDWDVGLLAVVLVLVGFGIVMLYSSSAVMSAQKLGDHLYLVKSQMVKVVLGIGLMVVAMNLDYRWYKRLIYPILIGAAGLLALVLVPGIGAIQNGAQRWLSIAGFSFQPAELVKLVVVMFLAYSVSKKGAKMGRFVTGFVPHILIVGGLVGLLMLQPDFGSSVILIMMMGLMLFVSGAKISYLGIFAFIGAFGAYYAIMSREYRIKRILAFLDPWSYRTDIGYQISESLISIGSGGLGGVGLGNGHGKLGYVPELWNDFIATIVAEELGVLGIALLVFLLGAFVWRGVKIAFRAQDEFGRYLAYGITMLFGIQSAANLFVVTGLAPTKGLTLPFVSFGGSSMLVALFATGVLLNISKNEPDAWDAAKPDREALKHDKKWERKRQSILKRRKDLARKYEDVL